MPQPYGTIPALVTPLTAIPVAERFAQRAFAGQDAESDDIDLVDVLDPDLFPIFGHQKKRK